MDEDLQQRPAYQEGCLTDQPDLSVYDQLFEEQENKEKDHEDDDHKQEECEDDDQPW